MIEPDLAKEFKKSERARGQENTPEEVVFFRVF